MKLNESKNMSFYFITKKLFSIFNVITSNEISLSTALFPPKKDPSCHAKNKKCPLKKKKKN